MKMTKYLFFIFFISLISCDTANRFESPEENYFIKFYGEDGDHEGVDFIANSDGTFVLLGNERVVGASLDQQIYLVKVDARGTVIWQRRFGIAGNEFAKDIELTPDGNIIIAAESQKGPNDRDVFVKIVSQNGDPLDSVRLDNVFKKIDGSESDEEVNSISLIQGGYIIAGSTTAVKVANSNNLTDALHIKLNASLDPVDPATGLWNNTSGFDDSSDVLVKMYEINSSTYYGFGHTNTLRINGGVSSRDYKYWAFSLGVTGVSSNNGTELLDVIGSPSEDEKLSCVIVSPPQDGEGFILSGVRTSISGASQSFIVKLQKNPFTPGEDNVLAEQSPTSLGNVNTVSSVAESTIRRTSITTASQGGYQLLTNIRSSTTEEFNIALNKLSNTFLTQGETPNTFGGIGNDFNGSIKELPDGKIILVGTMTLGGISGQTKIALMKVNSEGKFVP